MSENYESHSIYLVHYKMPDGAMKSVREAGRFVADRIMKLSWAKIEIISVEKVRET